MSNDKNKDKILNAENANKKEKVKGRSVWKKILKITGVFFLTIVVAIVVGIAGAWINGSFNPKKIYIQSLSIEGKKEHVSISNNDKSFKTTVKYLPEDANQLTLTAKVVTGADLIEEMPAVTAGEEFEIVFAKDENGITKGGEIEIKFLDSSQSAQATLKVLIDVSLNTNYIDITTNDLDIEYDEENDVLETNVLTTVREENANVIKIKASHDSMFNSYTGNWSESENNSAANLNRLKKMILQYNELDTSIQGFGANNRLMVEEVVGAEKYYMIKFLSPATTIEPFQLDIYIYKTYYMEKIFKEELVRDILDALESDTFSSNELNYSALNSFVNEYVYNDSSLEVKDNFAKFANNSTGLIELSTSKIKPVGKVFFVQALNDILDYVLIGKRILISVDNIVVSEILNTKNDSPIQLGVLQNINYGVEEVHSNLGITLSSQEANADELVLLNNLKKLEIFLCEKTEDVIDVTNVYNYFSIGGYAYKKVENNKNEYFELTKTMEDGVARWNLKTLSPMPGYSEFYLVYRYRNYDLTTAVPNPSSSEDQTTYYFFDDMWHTFRGSTYTVYPNSGTAGLNIYNKLADQLEDVYSASPIKITYTGGTINFNSEKNIVNATKTNFVLNNKVYTYTTTNGIQEVNNGEKNGVYYSQRSYSAGTDASKNNVILTSNSATSEMEYTMVKWFVPYYANIVDYVEGTTLEYDCKFYFMPVVETEYANNYNESEGEYYNPIPPKVRLKQVDSNSYFGSSSTYFMEIGTNNLTIEALNAMAGDLNIPLYAAIIQTNIEGEPYFINDEEDPDIVVPNESAKFTSAKSIRYHYVSITDTGTGSGHSLRIDNYIDELNFYVSEGSGEDSGYVSSSIESKVSLALDEVGYIYLSNLDLSTIVDGDGNIANDLSSIYNEKNEVIIQDAIDNLRNNRIALYNYYTDFIDGKTIADRNISFYVTYSGSVPENENSTELTVEPFDTTDFNKNNFIQIKIYCRGVATGGKHTYYVNATYSKDDTVANIKPPLSTDNNKLFFTAVESSNFGVFVLDGISQPSGGSEG